ncbi:MAG: chromosomal replication initiator protein DnaA [Patescibacteria group bacterium]|nr:chromosomal replication initiator protein DnaA [Patescibacteria group bacterium]
MTLDSKKLWDDTLAGIEVEVSKASFGTWFSKTRVIKQDGSTLVIGVPNHFVRDWLSDKYHTLILRSLRQLEPTVRGVEYIIAPRATNDQQTPIKPTVKPSFSNQLNLEELYTSREDNLNPKYIFDSFVVGPFNELAHAACQAVTKKVGQVYNPLYIYGGTGLGKTHLIQAVGNYIKKHHPNKKVFYVTSEQFGVDYVNSVRNNRANQFKEKYRKYDVLIMDDVQFFSNKDRTQEELFHLFNHYHEHNKQILFSSDKPPKQIVKLEERLRSRFEGGMMVDVIKPDYESRLAILNSKLTASPFSLEKEVIEYVANAIQDSIRELEGTVNSIVCQCQLKKRNLNLNEVKNLIKNNVKPKKTIAVKDVANIVANFYNINERYLYEKTRKKEVVKPRQVIMYILREDFNTSYPYIGQKMGNRDHTTVIHAYEKIRQDLKDNSLLSQEIEQIRLLLYKED